VTSRGPTPGASRSRRPATARRNYRPENAVHLDEVFAVAVEAGVAVEVNGLPDRLDLSAAHVQDALTHGVELVLNSDAHSARGLERLDLAVGTAR